MEGKCTCSCAQSVAVDGAGEHIGNFTPTARVNIRGTQIANGNTDQCAKNAAENAEKEGFVERYRHFLILFPFGNTVQY